MKDTTLCILSCHECGWHSPEQSKADMLERGLPWYCDNCSKKVTHFLYFEPEERVEAYGRLGIEAECPASASK